MRRKTKYIRTLCRNTSITLRTTGSWAGNPRLLIRMRLASRVSLESLFHSYVRVIALVFGITKSSLVKFRTMCVPPARSTDKPFCICSTARPTQQLYLRSTSGKTRGEWQISCGRFRNLLTSLLRRRRLHLIADRPTVRFRLST